ncbi:MAG: hypothetical protein KJN61_04615, partial [Gammaproteobacteria bacterium]|nr:hypothetical protein [Gammaproteobacteria bacterium]
MALLGFHPLDLGDISTSSARKVEDFLQKYLRAYFLVILVTTIAAAYYGYLDLHPFKMGDWLINYQGGFIRRGFLGELFLQLSLITNINPGVYALLFQISFYALFLWFSYSLLRRQAYLVPYAFLILSPFIFTFQINDLQGGFRKEIIYIALLAFIAWTANFSSRKCLRRTLLASMALYPAVILSHEMLAVFLPYLVIGYVSVSKLNYRTAWVICLAIIPSVIALLAVLSFPGDPEQLNGIINSLVAQGYPVEAWGILWLGVDTNSGLATVREHLDHYYFFAVPLFLSLIAFIPVSGRLLVIFKNRINACLMLASLLGT